MSFPIITIPNPILSTPAHKVRDFRDNLKVTIEKMREIMHAANGIGLAAPQIGLALKLAVIEFDPVRLAEEGEKPEGEPIPFFVIINPRVTQTSKQTDIQVEGCLSIPDVTMPISRSLAITVLALDKKGNRIKIRAKNFLARILQHEIDHLNGILITDHAKPKGKSRVANNKQFKI